MKQICIGLSLISMISLSSCGNRKIDATSTGDTTSTSDAVNRANGAAGLKDSVGKEVAGDTTVSGAPTKPDTLRR